MLQKKKVVVLLESAYKKKRTNFYISLQQDANLVQNAPAQGALCNSDRS